MHMSDALISTAVGAGLWVTSGGFGIHATSGIQKNLEQEKIPLMGVMGAFVFAGQMINFTIPGTGSSGHIGGGMLLAALLGSQAGFVTLAAVLLIQAMFFGDGGLLAYGCNVFNMSFFTCYLAYPLIFKPLLSKGITASKLMLASVFSVVIGLQLGAFGVVIETLLSGKTELPFSVFVSLMQPIHLAIGTVEGLVTGAILVFLWKSRPELIKDLAGQGQSAKHSLKTVFIALLVATVVLGGGVSLIASSHPDGLEWAMIKTSGSAELEATSSIHEKASSLQEKTVILPDYGFKEGSESTALLGTSLSGILGAGVTLIVLILMGTVVRYKKNRNKGLHS